MSFSIFPELDHLLENSLHHLKNHPPALPALALNPLLKQVSSLDRLNKELLDELRPLITKHQSLKEKNKILSQILKTYRFGFVKTNKQFDFPLQINSCSYKLKKTQRNTNPHEISSFLRNTSEYNLKTPQCSNFRENKMDFQRKTLKNIKYNPCYRSYRVENRQILKEDPLLSMRDIRFLRDSVKTLKDDCSLKPLSSSVSFREHMNFKLLSNEEPIQNIFSSLSFKELKQIEEKKNLNEEDSFKGSEDQKNPNDSLSKSDNYQKNSLNSAENLINPNITGKSCNNRKEDLLKGVTAKKNTYKHLKIPVISLNEVNLKSFNNKPVISYTSNENPLNSDRDQSLLTQSPQYNEKKSPLTKEFNYKSDLNYQREIEQLEGLIALQKRLFLKEFGELERRVKGLEGKMARDLMDWNEKKEKNLRKITGLIRRNDELVKMKREYETVLLKNDFCNKELRIWNEYLKKTLILEEEDKERIIKEYLTEKGIMYQELKKLQSENERL